MYLFEHLEIFSITLVSHHVLLYYKMRFTIQHIQYTIHTGPSRGGGGGGEHGLVVQRRSAV